MTISNIGKMLVAAVLMAASGSLLAAQQNYTNIWWKANESGWGLFVVDQQMVQFPSWYTYDENGKATWFIGAAMPTEDNVYQGKMFRYTGVPFDQIVGKASDPAVLVGDVTLNYSSPQSMNFSYTVDGVTQSKQLTPFPLAGADRELVCTFANEPASDNATDVWYDPDSLGWGVVMMQVPSAITVAWYTYGEDRQPIWLLAQLMPQADGSFSGDVSQGSTGTPFMDIQDAIAGELPQKVGTANVRFDGSKKATFGYTIGDVTQTRSVERLILAAPQSCGVQSTKP